MGNTYEDLGSKAWESNFSAAGGSRESGGGTPSVWWFLYFFLIKIPHFEAYLSLNFCKNLFLLYWLILQGIAYSSDKWLIGIHRFPLWCSACSVRKSRQAHCCLWEKVLFAILGRLQVTGVTRNFHWGAKTEKFCDVILVTFFGDVMKITSLTWRYNWFFVVRFCHNQLEKPQFGQINLT